MALELVPPPSALDQIGFELGWDYAHYGLAPAEPYAQEDSPLRDGLRAGRATFGSRSLTATPHVRRWLQLRLAAWLRGRSVELVQVTPNYLAQIDASHCPITREPLVLGSHDGRGASIDRVRNDAGYAAGNLAVMSSRANQAKAACGYREALGLARRAGHVAQIDGLCADEWWRVAVLCSFVDPLPHDEACALPLLVLPPNRLRLFNPAQALQAFLSRQLLEPGWSQRLRRIAALLPGKPARRALLEFFAALLPRVLEAGRNLPPQAARWALEDAWHNPLAQKRWSAFARPLGAAGCEALLARASAKGLGAQAVMQLADTAATEGWALDSRGYVAHAASRVAPPGAPVQACLPL